MGAPKHHYTQLRHGFQPRANSRKAADVSRRDRPENNVTKMALIASTRFGPGEGRITYVGDAHFGHNFSSDPRESYSVTGFGASQLRRTDAARPHCAHLCIAGIVRLA